MSAPPAPCAICGHRAEEHEGVGCRQATFSMAQVSNIAVYCQCKAYRTKDQIDALVFLRVMERQRGHRGYQEEKLGDAARQVLEAFS